MKKILALLLLAVSVAVSAKTITVTLPFPPGGATDRAWRTLLPMLSQELRQHNLEFVTDYRPGGGGTVAAEHVIAQTETHLFFTSASVAISAATNTTASHRAEDFRLLGYFGTLPMMFVVSPNMPNNMKDFAKHCRTRRLNMGSAGVGSTIHLVAESVMKSIGCESVNVPYKGPAAALPDLAAGRIDFMVDYTASSTGSLAQEGKIRNIMTIASQRTPEFATVPTASELGINVNELKNWQVLLVNTRSDSREVELIQQAIQRIVSNPDNLAQFRAMGLEGAGDRVSGTFLRDSFNFYRRYVNRQ